MNISLVNCLKVSLQLASGFLLLYGTVTIIYSLWLHKICSDGFSNLGLSNLQHYSWFIYACLGIGILACFSSMCFCVVNQPRTNFTLLVYVLLFIVIITLELVCYTEVFSVVDWNQRLLKYLIDDKNFRDFVEFHIEVCRMVYISVIPFQIVAVILELAFSLRRSNEEQPPFEIENRNFSQSFLVPVQYESGGGSTHSDRKWSFSWLEGRRTRWSALVTPQLS